LLRAPPKSLPEKIALFGVVEIHDFPSGNACDFARLSNNLALCARQNYNIIILFFCLISVGKGERP